MVLCFVLDANLFISLARTGTHDIVKMLREGAEAMEAELVSTPQMLDEIGNLPTVEEGQRLGMASAVRKAIKVKRLLAEDMTAMRKTIGKGGPQTTDLTLMELARQRARRGDETVLVSNDFKIHLYASKLDHPYRVASPAVMLHTLAEGTTGELRQRFFKLYHQLREAEMAYMLEKHKTFPAQPKLSWLIDNLMSTTITQAGQEETGLDPDNIQQGPVDLTPLYHHLRGEPIHQVVLEPFKNLLSHIEPLGQVMDYRDSLRTMLEDGWYEEAYDQLRDLIDHLEQHLQRSSTQLPYRERLWLRQLYSGELLLLYQAAGLLALAQGRPQVAEMSFQRCTMLALVAEQPLKSAKMHYLHGLARLQQDYPLGGVRAFQLALRFTPQEAYLRFRARLALALAQLQLGEGVAAENTLERLRKDISEAPHLGAWQLIRLGDELYHFGLPDFAAMVYREGLEWAVTAGETGVEPARNLMPRLSRTRSYIPGGAAELDRQLKRLIRLTTDLDDPQVRTGFLAALAELQSQEIPLSEMLDEIFDDWTPVSQLPPMFQVSWEVVATHPIDIPLPGLRRSGEGPEQACLLLCHNPRLGNLAVYYPRSFAKTQTEAYSLKFQPEGQIKLAGEEAELLKTFKVRGVLIARTSEAVLLERAAGLLTPGELESY